MNASRLEQLLLLEQSGELTEKQRRALDADLAANPAARQFRAELQHLAAAVPPVRATPAPGTSARIAARLAGARPFAVFRPAWRPALAAAAALALLIGLRTYHGQRAPAGEAPAAAVTAAAEEEEWTDPLEADFTELENLLVAIDSSAALDITEL